MKWLNEKEKQTKGAFTSSDNIRGLCLLESWHTTEVEGLATRRGIEERDLGEMVERGEAEESAMDSTELSQLTESVGGDVE